MIWLTWRQLRASALLVGAGLALVAAVLVATEPHLSQLYAPGGAYESCQRGDSCLVFDQEWSRYRVLHLLSPVVVVLPALLAMFWGAPLVARELESGTFRLAWTQSVTRTRWLLVKLAVVGLTCALASGAFALMVGWWSSPVDRTADTRLAPGLFDARGVAPVGYAVFAFVLAVTVGVIVRRTVPAMAVTLAAFLAVRLAVLAWVRPHLARPLTTVRDHASGWALFDARLRPRGAWVLSDVITNGSGQRYDVAKLDCPPDATDPSCPARVQHYVAQFHEVLRYQPASRYWLLQGEETVLFLAASAVLVVLCVWWLRRRLA